MSNSGEKIEFENDAVRVLRVKVGAREQHPVRKRHDRVLIWLSDSHHVRSDADGKHEEIHRKAGEVAWRPASEHRIASAHDAGSELIIVELKR